MIVRNFEEYKAQWSEFKKVYVDLARRYPNELQDLEQEAIYHCCGIGKRAVLWSRKEMLRMPRFGRGRGWGFGRGYWPRAGFGWGFGLGRGVRRFYPLLPARRWAMGMTPYAALYPPYVVRPV